MARSPRDGLTTIEMVAALAVLLAMMVLVTRTMHAQRQADRKLDRRREALEAAGNYMERLVAGETDVADLQVLEERWNASEPIRRLPGGSIHLSQSRLDQGPSGVQFTVTIRWGGSPGVVNGAVELVGWRFLAAEDGA